MRRRIIDIFTRKGSVKPSREPLCTTSLSGSDTLLYEYPCAPTASILVVPSTTITAKPDVAKEISSSSVLISIISADASTDKTISSITSEPCFLPKSYVVSGVSIDEAVTSLLHIPSIVTSTADTEFSEISVISRIVRSADSLKSFFSIDLFSLIELYIVSPK